MKKIINENISYLLMIMSIASLTGCVTGQSGDNGNTSQVKAIQNIISSSDELKCVNANFMSSHKTCESGQVCNGDEVYLHVTNKCGRTINATDAYFLFASVDTNNNPLILKGNQGSNFDYFPMDKINTLYHPQFQLSAGESKDFLIQGHVGLSKSLDTRFADGSLMIVDAKKRPNFYQCYEYSTSGINRDVNNTITWAYKLMKPSLASQCQEWLTEYSAKFTVKDGKKQFTGGNGEFLMNSSCQLSQKNSSVLVKGCSQIAYSTMENTIVPLGVLDYWLKNPHNDFINQVESFRDGMIKYSFNQYGNDLYNDTRYNLAGKYISNNIPVEMYRCISLKIDNVVEPFNYKKSQLKLVNSCNYDIDVSDYAIGFRGYAQEDGLTTIAQLVESTLAVANNQDSKLMLGYDHKYDAQLRCVGKCVIKANNNFITNPAAIFVNQNSYTSSTPAAISGITHISSVSQQYNSLSMISKNNTSIALTNVNVGEYATIIYEVRNNSQNNMLERIIYKPLPHGFSYQTEPGYLDCANVLLSGGDVCLIKIKYTPTHQEKGNLQFNLPEALVSTGLDATLNIPYGTYYKPAEFEILQINPETHNMNNRLTNIPINSAGMVSYKITNHGDSDATQAINLPTLHQPFSYYTGWSDISDCHDRILKPKERCFVLIRYVPTEVESGNLNYIWPDMLADAAQEKGFDNIPYATR